MAVGEMAAPDCRHSTSVSRRHTRKRARSTSVAGSTGFSPSVPS